VNVYVEVQNTGTVKGDETAFLFASYPETKAPAPNGRHKKELKAFYRVTLNPGEKKGILIPVRLEDLRYWNNGWQVESGPVKVAVAGSSDDEALAKNTTTFTVK
jgi:beta-glucosidase